MRRASISHFVLATLVAGGLGIVGSATASSADTTVFAPPYPAASGGAECYPEGAEGCSTSVTPDAATGDVSPHASVTAPGDGLEEPVWAFAQGSMDVAVAIDEPAAAVDVRVTVHIHHAEVGHRDGSAVDWSYADLYASLHAVHEACSTCHPTWRYEEVEFADGSEFVTVDDEVVVVDARITNGGEDVPSGSIDIEAALGGTVFMEPDETGTKISAAEATVTEIAVTPIVVAETRAVAKRYLGLAGDAYYLGATGPNCTREGASTGGACFRVAEDDVLVSFSIADDRSATPIGAQWQLLDDADEILSSGNFCGASGRAWVPEGATQAVVLTHTVLSPLRCDEPSAATTGTVTARFFG